MSKSLSAFRDWCKEARNYRMRKIFSLLNLKLSGYYNYYGVIGNTESLNEFFFNVKMILFKWLNRRSQRKSFNWTVFLEIINFYNLARPRIMQRRNNQREFVFTATAEASIC